MNAILPDSTGPDLSDPPSVLLEYVQRGLDRQTEAMRRRHGSRDEIAELNRLGMILFHAADVVRAMEERLRPPTRREMQGGIRSALRAIVARIP